MKNQWAVAGAVVLSAFGGGTSAKAEDWADRLNQLEQRQNVLERKYEADQENAANGVKEAAPAIAGVKDGFGLKSSDGAFALKLYGDVQADGRFYLSDGSHGQPSALTDTFLLRRVRPSAEVVLYKWITGRLQPNFGGGAASLDEAYANLAFRPAVQFRAGRFNPRWDWKISGPAAGSPSWNAPCPRASCPTTTLASNSGEPWGPCDLRLLLTNGAVDGGNMDGADTTDRKDFAARVFLTPFKTSARPSLAGLGFGFAGSMGRAVGYTSAPGLTAGYKTNGQSTFFAYQGRAIAAGNRARWSPQFTWFPGRLGVLGEYVASRQTVRSTVTLVTADLLHRAWQLAASYVLTGEEVTEKGVKPRNPYEPGKPGWGAWEIAARVSRFNAGRATFDTVGANTSFADPGSSARAARSFSGGLNWYLNNNVKVQADYEHTSFDGGATSGHRPVERALLTRVQWSY